MYTHTSSIFPSSARPTYLIIRRPSLVYHYHRSHLSQSFQQHSCFHPNQLSYRSHRVHSCSNVNLSTMNFGRSNYRDQGVHGGSQSGSSNLQPRVGTERREEQQHGRNVDDFSRGKRRGSPVYDLYTGFLGKEEEKSSAIYGSWDAGSQALKISTSSSASTSNSKSEGFTSPYGVYDMDDTSFFAHTTRLNLIGPYSNSTQFPRPRSSYTERMLINSGERSMVTAAASSLKIDRSCSPSPPVPPDPEKHTSPTESYMQLSLQPSLPLVDPTALRKLLVLDLNGTLLLRSAHHRRHAHSSGHGLLPINNSIHHPLPAIRTVYLRPYLPSFRNYIFHPTTLRWLDTMVWSSAQPHSVNDMVDKCFGHDKEELKAIWARDTFGLSSKDYYRKTKTVKDLAKPWAECPSLIPNLNHTRYQPEDPDSELEVDEDRDNDPLVPKLQQQQQHSALTTVLIDDSPFKAALQPWNHLCVPEYDTGRRKKDVEKSEVQEEEDMEKLREPLEVKGGKERIRRVEVEEQLGVPGQNEIERMEDGFVAGEPQLEVQGEEEEGYDSSLLAVIGILDALKHEGNVAGWIRSGGLVNVVDDQETVSETSETEMLVTTTIPNPQTTTLTSSMPLTPSKRDCSTISIQGPSKRRRLTHDTDLDPASASGERILGLDSDSEMVALPITTTPTVATIIEVEQARTGVPLSTTAEAAASTTPISGNKDSESTSTPVIQPQHEPLLWYESTRVHDYWVQRGKEALAKLGIDVIHGVVSPNSRRH